MREIRIAFVWKLRTRYGVAESKFRGCSTRRRREINDSGLLETRPSVAFSSPRRTSSLRMFSASVVLARRMDTIVALRSNRTDRVRQREVPTVTVPIVL